jgi:mono-ADP-ribosyltransferase sirtuin 6
MPFIFCKNSEKAEEEERTKTSKKKTKCQPKKLTSLPVQTRNATARQNENEYLKISFCHLGMSLSYAARLTQNVDYGECGLPEMEDTARVKAREMTKLVKLLKDASYLVIHTGAGISTCKRKRFFGAILTKTFFFLPSFLLSACGIRDFRGPNGVWTRERKGLGLELLPGDVPFDEASPSLTHMAVLALVQSGRCKFVVSQNVDGLHLRSGLQTEKLAELHGNIFQVSSF